MALPATDNFDRANNADLGTNWDANPTEGAFSISTNTAVPASLVVDCCETWNADAFPDNQYAQAKITITGTTAETGLGVVVRASNTEKTFYLAVVNKAASNNVTVVRRVAASYVVIGQRTTTWVDSDILKLSVEDTTLKVYQNGSQLGADINDNNISSGRAGVKHQQPTTAGNIEDWEGGEIAVAAPTEPRRIFISRAG